MCHWLMLKTNQKQVFQILIFKATRPTPVKIGAAQSSQALYWYLYFRDNRKLKLSVKAPPIVTKLNCMYIYTPVKRTNCNMIFLPRIMTFPPFE